MAVRELSLDAGQRWNARDYAQNGRFVADLAGGVVGLLQLQPGERVLDLGCGDGALSRRLVDAGAVLVGIDASDELVAAACERGIDARVGDGQALALDPTFDQAFDAIFSNAAMHWMKRDPDAVIRGAWKALVPGGRFVAEFGGAGNVAQIRRVLHAALGRRGIDPDAVDPWYFPRPQAYRARLERAGFEVREIALHPRPTVLPSDIGAWLRTFAGRFTDALPEVDRAALIDEVQRELQASLSDGKGRWIADYVRLRFVAYKPGLTA